MMQQNQFNSGAIEAGECISNAWTLVSGKFGMYLGMGILTILMISCIPFVSIFLAGPVMGGFYYVVLRDMDGEPVEFGMLFKGFENFLPLMITGIVVSIPGIIITIFQYTVDIARLIGPGVLPQSGNFYQAGARDAMLGGISMFLVIFIIGFTLFSIVWQVALTFAVPLIVDRGLPVGEALALSARAAASNIGGLVLLIILQILVGLLGLIALCVGLFVAVPVIYAANAFAFRQVFPRLFQRAPDAPPTPDMYGDNFGRAI